MTPRTPEQAQATMNALVVKQQRAWRALAIYCETGKPITREHGVEIFEVSIQVLDVYLGLLRRLAKSSRPLIPIPELMDMAERVTVRLQNLAQRVSGDGPQSARLRNPSQPTRL